MFHCWNPHGGAASPELKGAERWCRVGGAWLSCALGLPRKRMRPSASGSFIARPVALFGITLPNIQPPPLRCGHAVTGRPRPRSRRRGIVSGASPPKPHKRLVGRRSKSLRVGQRTLNFSEAIGCTIWRRQKGLISNSPTQRNVAFSRCGVGQREYQR